ncbi:chromate efflux transporter [Mesorhizobium sp. BAC0120]|uniref:chromate efflux transporter n=1 Tax=Mesorhizobium sp. BAC0120 TaxID=3090670 RepID=UPI00298CF786|nr:chromate efflux transporter [Mesorhizobium sp. BAC0120]MDW6022310.1 chromate efflux transporter [Mesorhizobium sp. BAC0120]
MDAKPTRGRGNAGYTSALVILGVFLKLGLTSFGGPIAHLGYFRAEFVARRRWLDERVYADLVALCQFLPGPASSQVGFAVGLMRGGIIGALAAWVGFTLPSALLLLAFAQGVDTLTGPVAAGALHGLKIVAVAVVAQAVWGMARTLAPDRPRATIAGFAVLAVVLVGGALGQIAAIAFGAIIGIALAGHWIANPQNADTGDGLPSTIPLKAAGALIVAALLLLATLPIARNLGIGGQGLALFDAFYRAGALVFGGGHVVLPLLKESVVASGWVSPDAFLAGYGAAQAVPGPLFTIAAYLGAVSTPAPNGVVGAMIALVAIFLPGLLLVAGTLPFWSSVSHVGPVRSAMIGINAAVVGVLGAALYDPVFTGAVHSPPDFALALVAFLLLTVWRTPPWVVVLFTGACGALLLP